MNRLIERFLTKVFSDSQGSRPLSSLRKWKERDDAKIVKIEEALAEYLRLHGRYPQELEDLYGSHGKSTWWKRLVGWKGGLCVQGEDGERFVYVRSDIDYVLFSLALDEALDEAGWSGSAA